MAEAGNTDTTNIPGLTGDTCLGYRLGKKLGAGGFAFVREAYDRDGKRVAIKFIKMDKQDTKLHKTGNAIVAVDENNEALETISSRLKRTLKEITTELMGLQMTSSPNVVELYKYKLNHPYKMSNGTTWNSLAMVLEICDNGELFDLVYHGEALEEKVCRTFFRQIVNGLEALHSKNIAHRDIKPQNILLTKDFQCKLADLGSGARFRDSRLMKTVRVGTRGFQAPELLCGKNYSKKCDTFSLGVTLFVLMSKTMPCREEATVKDPLYVYMAAKKYNDYWEKFRRGNIHFSENLMKLLQGMLAYQPVERMNINDTANKDGVNVPGIKSCAWYNEDVFEQAELRNVLQDRFKLARNKKNKCRNPENEVNSQTFRGDPPVLPFIPPGREIWALPVDPEATVMDSEDNVVKLQPDHLIHSIMNKFEVQDTRCTTVYNEADGELEMKGIGAGNCPFTVQVNAYQNDSGDFFLDIRPTDNWHHPDCKKLADDVQNFLFAA